MIQGVKDANKCIECGFCEVNCVSCGLTLSSRMRIAIQREISRLEETGENPSFLQKLREQYRYLGDQTCASDGLCATSCPMKINTGDLTHLIRQINMLNNGLGHKAGDFCANHMDGIKRGLRGVLNLAHMGHYILGDKMMTAITK